MRFTILVFLFLLINTSLAKTVENTRLKEDKSSASCRCQPEQACWPNENEWLTLSKQLSGRLIKPKNELEACYKNVNSQDCEMLLKNMHNPFYLQEQPDRTESQGWYNAWRSTPSEYAIEAKTTNDVVAAVNFARKHNLKLAIKGAGHDYLGRNTSPHSLLIWTHPMRKITMHEAFRPTGCPQNQKEVHAVTVQAGSRWIEAYTEVTTKNKRYVQGGGCTSVGVAGGFTQGGGFGSFSKKYGSGASNVLQVEMVTANGTTLIANACQNPDLFFAVRGGGGATFGVVTEMTLETFDLPSNFGVIKGKIVAKSDDEYKKLIKAFLAFYRDHLNNAHWGEQFSFNQDNTISIIMLFQGLSKEQVIENWQPLQQWIKNANKKYQMEYDIFIIPSDKMWDYTFWKESHPEYVERDSRANAPEGQYWWAPNTGEASKYWYTYLSRWLPMSLFENKALDTTSNAIFQASREAPITLHINKGLAGAAPEALERSKRTAINPVVHDAGALVILATGSNQVFLGVEGKEPNKAKMDTIVKKYQAAYQIIKDLTPHSGTYVNESNFFEPDWQTAFWGSNYQKLYEIKQKYDPDGLFYCHHCVGSELVKGSCLDI